MIKHSKNKIELCRECLDALTPAQDNFCSEQCKEKWTQKKGKEAMLDVEEAPKYNFYYVNKNMLNLCRGEHVDIFDFSPMLYNGNDLVCAALIEENGMQSISDSEKNVFGAWSRKMAKGQIPNQEGVIVPHITEIEKKGLLQLLSQQGITTERDVAIAVYYIAEHFEVTPIQLFEAL